MRRNVRVVKDIQSILFQRQLVRLVLPTVEPRTRDTPISGKLVAYRSDLNLCMTEPVGLSCLDHGPSRPVEIVDVRRIVDVAKGAGADAYLLGEPDFIKEYRCLMRVNVPIAFYMSEKADLVIATYCPF